MSVPTATLFDASVLDALPRSRHHDAPRPRHHDAPRADQHDAPRADQHDASRADQHDASPRPGHPEALPAPPPSRTVVQLLTAAREELRAAQQATTPGERFSSAHLAALRSAAAVLAVRAQSRRSARPSDAWSLLARVAPEYGEWAAFFAAHSATRSAVEAGVRGRVGQRDADDMVRQADLFLALVTRTVAGRDR